MIAITEEKQCCGCGACNATCPVGCIEMVAGTLGAVFPIVDSEKCIRCKRCESVCPMLHAQSLKHSESEQQVFAAYAKDTSVRFSGSSGGIFGVLAKHLISKGYVVYGAGFDDNLKLRCMEAHNEAMLRPLLKSKYLQSDMSSQYKNIRKKLECGEQVFFVSTPCQAAALKRFLGRDYEGLIIVDFLCHGVPSQELFDKCLDYEERHHRYKILDYRFRTKIPKGATPHYFTVQVDKNGHYREITAPYFKSVYYAFFQQYISLRESCYDCIFSEQKRVSDLTIADFHDIEKYTPIINRFDGISTVIVNTEKGDRLLNCVKDELCYHPFVLDRLIADGVLFSQKTQRPARRDAFVEGYTHLDFDTFVRLNIPTAKYAVYGVYYKLPRRIRFLIRKLFNIE